MDKCAAGQQAADCGAPGLLLYAENYPAPDHQYATGLDRALSPILAALGPMVSGIALRPPRGLRARLQSLNPVAAGRSILPSFSAVFADQLLSAGGGRQTRGHQDGSLRRQLAGYGPFPNLLSVLGSNPASYIRAHSLAKDIGARHYIYSVDDYRRGLISSPFAEQDQQELALTFSSAAGIFTITTSLAEQYSALYPGHNVQALPLPFIENGRQAKRLLKQIIYVGNINHLYADAIQDVIEAVNVLNEAGFEIEIRITSVRSEYEKFLGAPPKFVRVGPINDRDGLLQEIADSRIALCAISFAENNDMVVTSFPSKLLDYLSSSCSILLYGPDYCEAKRYFVDNRLPTIVTEKARLVAVIRSLIVEPPNNASRYRAALSGHGPERFRERVASIISVKP
ncbi:MAG: hypothetical protein QE280_15765 [Caulobacter sp.]|nr:hypothetical protein [Caulobacter sp.]